MSAVAEPHGARDPVLGPRREAVAVRDDPHPPRPLAAERIAVQHPQRRGIRFEEAHEERGEPVLERPPERQEPHQPVEPQVIRRELPRDAADVARLALERVLAPRGGVGIGIRRALDDVLDALLRDGAERTVGVRELPPVEACVHELTAREEVPRGGHAERDVPERHDTGDDDPVRRNAAERRGIRHLLTGPGHRHGRERQHDRRPVQPREVARQHEPQLRRDDDRRREVCDDGGPGPGDPQPQDRREQEPRHDQLREMVAQDFAAVKPRRQEVRLAAEGAGHGLRLVVVHQRREVAPLPPAADLDHSGAELQAEHQPPHQHDHRRGRRLGIRPEEGREKPRLEQQHLPPEPVERLPDRGDRHVSEPQREESEHRQPGRAELRDAGDEQRRDDDPGDAQRDEAPVGVADPAEQRRAQQLRARRVRGRPREQRRRRQQSALAEQWPELGEARRERDQEQRGGAPLEHLPRELEVDRREAVHAVTLRRGIRRENGGSGRRDCAARETTLRAEKPLAV